jgi:hypothetical protein
MNEGLLRWQWQRQYLAPQLLSQPVQGRDTALATRPPHCESPVTSLAEALTKYAQSFAPPSVTLIL